MRDYKYEKIEWTNIWCEDCDEDNKPRILLVGDSITQGYGRYVYEQLDKKWGLTLMATSAGIDNPRLLEQILLLGKQFENKFDYVHFNNGLHAFYITDENFEKNYRETVKVLKETFVGAKMGIATSTNMCEKTENGFVLAPKNDIALSRNKIMRSVGAELGIPVDDLYEVAIQDLNYHCDDAIHFTADGYKVLAAQVVRFLKSL